MTVRAAAGRRAALVWTAALIGAVPLGDALWRSARVAPGEVRLALAAAPLLLWAAAALVLGLPPPGARSREPRRPPGGMLPGLLDALRQRGLLGRRARYRLPLFVVLGPPGAGKSSLLRRVDPSLALPEDGEDGTTWWIGRDALLVEVAAGIVDPEGLADALLRFRPLLPLSGILAVVSPADLALADALEREAISEAMAAVVAALERRAGVSAPIYLALAKMDLTPGFSDTFDLLEARERDQPWGFSLPRAASEAGSDEAVGAVRAGLRAAIEVPRLRLIAALSQAGDPPRGGRLLNFGAQVALALPLLEGVVASLAVRQGGGSRRGAVPHGASLRGVFFTSAGSEALTLDGLLPEMSARLAMPRSGTLPPRLDAPEARRGFFAAELLGARLLPEAGLARGPRPPLHRRRAVAAGVALATAATAAAGAAGLVSAYASSRERLAHFELTAPGVAPARPGSGDVAGAFWWAAAGAGRPSRATP